MDLTYNSKNFEDLSRLNKCVCITYKGELLKPSTILNAIEKIADKYYVEITLSSSIYEIWNRIKNRHGFNPNGEQEKEIEHMFYLFRNSTQNSYCRVHKKNK